MILARFSLRRFLLLILILLLPLGVQGAEPEVRSIASNFAWDLLGTPDDRANTWGNAEAQYTRITFRPPAGKRVRILRVYGDFLIWPNGVVPPGRFAGALFGLQTTNADDLPPEQQPRQASAYADWADDHTLLYIQTATGGAPARAEFNYDTSAAELLGPDHALIVKVAVWLNDTGLAIHMEPSFVVVYQFEDEPAPVRRRRKDEAQ